MTSHHWAFSMAALGAHLGVEQLRVINDFTALALPALGNADLLTIGRVNAGFDDTPNTEPFATNALHYPGCEPTAAASVRLWLAIAAC